MASRLMKDSMSDRQMLRYSLEAAAGSFSSSASMNASGTKLFICRVDAS
jgi:hypothetical protein